MCHSYSGYIGYRLKHQSKSVSARLMCHTLTRSCVTHLHAHVSRTCTLMCHALTQLQHAVVIDMDGNGWSDRFHTQAHYNTPMLKQVYMCVQIHYKTCTCRPTTHTNLLQHAHAEAGAC
jgi:hypothetical protein